jgi:hypothetical protein
LPAEGFLVSLDVSVDTSDPIPDTEVPNQDETNVDDANQIKDSAIVTAGTSIIIRLNCLSYGSIFGLTSSSFAKDYEKNYFWS